LTPNVKKCRFIYIQTRKYGGSFRMDTEKKDVKAVAPVATPAPVAAPKAEPAKAAVKTAAKKPAAKKPAAKKAAKKPAAKKAAPKADAKKAEAKKPAAKKAAAKKPAAKKAAAKKVAAKKPAKKAAAPAKKAEIIFQIDGQEISAAAIAKKLPKAGKIYVVANEKKAYDVDGNGVDLF
jgi:hypothetical protein